MGSHRVFLSWLIFTEWKYHFQETPKASYFSTNEAPQWEKKATEDTGKPRGPMLNQGSLVELWKPIYTQGSLSVFQFLFTLWMLVSVISAV